ncbi:hypothetical protein FACS1894127_6270 [Clostridia bacterium]|nr:hypothetical protein FACS1894127_6270 [Clostridia bacterium]
MDETEGRYQKIDVISKLFGVSVRRVQQLTQEGVIKTSKVGRSNRYDLIPTLQAYIAYLQDKAYSREKSDIDLALKEQKMKADISLKESQGELHILKTKIAAGKYVDVDEVKLDYALFFTAFKNFAMSLPHRVAVKVKGHADPSEVMALEKDLKREVVKQLQNFTVAGVMKDEKV